MNILNNVDQQTIDTYNKLAYSYDEEVLDFWKDFPREFIEKFCSLSGPSVVSVGSGTAQDALLLQEAGKHVVCLDASEVMVRISSERGFKSVVGSFDALPFENGSFDAAWVYTSLLHTPKNSIGAPLAEIHRVLKPSGIFALGLIEGDTETYKLSSGVQSPRLFSLYRKEEVIELCNKYGFELAYFSEFMPRSKNYLNFIFRKK